MHHSYILSFTWFSLWGKELGLEGGITFKDLVASTLELKGQSWCAWAASSLLTTERQLSRGPVLNRLLEERSPEGVSCFLHRGESMRHVMWSWCVCYAQERPTSPPRRAQRDREWERRKDGRLMKEVNKQNLTDDHCDTILMYFVHLLVFLWK